MIETIQSIEIQQDVVSSFEEWLEEAGKEEKTIAAYMRDVQIYLRWFEFVNQQPFEPGLMNSTDLRHFRQHSLEIEKVSPATWNRRHASLGQFCKFLADTYDVSMFSMRKVQRAAVEESAPRALSPADKRKVLRELELQVLGANTELRVERALRDQAMVGLMLFAMVRVSEAVKLTLNDVVLTERTGKIFIRDSKHHRSGWVPLSSTARDFLQDWLAVRKSDSEYVFVDDQGKGITTRAVQKRIQKLEDRLGIDGLEPHALRHTGATEMLDAGVPLNQIRQVLRHKRLETTLRYVQPSEADLMAAVEAGELGRFRR